MVESIGRGFKAPFMAIFIPYRHRTFIFFPSLKEEVVGLPECPSSEGVMLCTPLKLSCLGLAVNVN